MCTKQSGPVQSEFYTLSPVRSEKYTQPVQTPSSTTVDVLPLVECGGLYSLYLTLLKFATNGWATFFFNNHHLTQ